MNNSTTNKLGFTQETETAIPALATTPSTPTVAPEDLNVILEIRAGSHAYGTNIASSDIDRRGIFCASEKQLITRYDYLEEIEGKEPDDYRFYELFKFTNLLSDQNPNIMEILWTQGPDVLAISEAGLYLQSQREKLLSKKVAKSYVEYAVSQMKRIKGHNKMLMKPQPEEAPQIKDFAKIRYNFTNNKDYNKALPQDGYVIYPSGGDMWAAFSVDKLLTLYPNYRPKTELFDERGAPKGREKQEFNKLKDAGFKPDILFDLPMELYKERFEEWKKYWSWLKNRNPARSELEIKYGFDCYTDDTEFLTSTGWKKFDEVLETDNLATFNELSHKIEYQAPTEKIDSRFTGNLYHLTGYHTDTMVTSNHNMYVRPYSRNKKEHGKWGYERAAELSETFETLNVIEPKKNRQLLPSGINLQLLNHVTLLNYLRLVGCYVSDGTINFYKDKKVKHMVISQSKPQSRLTQTLNKLRTLEKIHCHHYLYKASGLSNHPENKWVFNKEISEIIYNDCGHKSEFKRLPSWCFFLTKREMSTLLIALLQGDGTKRNHQPHTYIYYTINKNLADDVQRLAFLCGYETSLYGPYPPNSANTKVVSKNSIYQVHINMRPEKTRRHSGKNALQTTPVVNHRVVCFMVPNWTLVTRRNGHVGLHGNTKHAMHTIRLLRSGYEILTQNQVNVRRPDAQELISIREGAWSYERLLEEVRVMQEKVSQIVAHSTLPDNVDRQLIAEITHETYQRAWGRPLQLSMSKPSVKMG